MDRLALYNVGARAIGLVINSVAGASLDSVTMTEAGATFTVSKPAATPRYVGERRYMLVHYYNDDAQTFPAMLCLAARIRDVTAKAIDDDGAELGKLYNVAPDPSYTVSRYIAELAQDYVSLYILPRLDDCDPNGDATFKHSHDVATQVARDALRLAFEAVDPWDVMSYAEPATFNMDEVRGEWFEHANALALDAWDEFCGRVLAREQAATETPRDIVMNRELHEEDTLAALLNRPEFDDD